MGSFVVFAFLSFCLSSPVALMSPSTPPPPDLQQQSPEKAQHGELLPKPNKEVILLFGVSGCTASRLSSSIQSLIADAARQTSASKVRLEGKQEKEEESIKPRVSAGVGSETKRGTARSKTVYVLQQEGPPSSFREGGGGHSSPFPTQEGPAARLNPQGPPSPLRQGAPPSPLCEVDSVTLHHMDCVMIHLQKCTSFINPDILMELASWSECVNLVDFDYKAWPISSSEGTVSPTLSSHVHAEEKEGEPHKSQNLPPFIPNDPLLLSGAQWELLDTAGVQARKAWMATKGGEGSVEEQPGNTIAVIDFGFNIPHEDMFDSWWRNALVEAPSFSEWPDNCHDGIDNDANGYVDDCFGYSFADRSGEIPAFAGSHGTAVASSCCATTNNGKGIASLGWNLRPMALKIDGSYSQIAEALNYAADKKVLVVNMSFGGPPSAALRASLGVAAARDMSLIVAAGNHQCDLATVAAGGCFSESGSRKGFPAGYGDLLENVIAVAAVAPDGKPAKFTNFDSSANPKIHVLAPGDSILTCSNVGTQGKLLLKDKRHWCYVRASGTSFATPIVAAVAALVRYERPELTAKDVKRLLVGSCRSAAGANLQKVAKCGGILSAARALKNAGVYPVRVRNE
ncbi:hypothetical protein Esti_004912 [Eimeria stiedai]